MESPWIDWNIEHFGKHGITAAEAEWVVKRNRATDIGHSKYRVRGQICNPGRYIQAIFLLDPHELVFVINARDLTVNETRLLRRGVR